MDHKLTYMLKEYAYQLGSDLVGVADIKRFEKAPAMMSPQGILPTAKSVIVCAIHHPDACIELGGEPEPQDIGPYAIQYTMNSKLDVISFKVARMLDDLGYKTVPIASSNIWRYREYKELDAVFSPDISHIYAAVAAGLGELGWNGLALTPEYGARNRFVSIITEAELELTPLYDGPKLCDICGECIRNCPTDAYRKEVNGVKKIEIEGREYRFANKNLWRCAWGEHFDLDLNLEIPDVVDEQVIIDNVRKYGMRGGEFGVCLRVCLPPHMRYEDPGYTRVYRRKRHFMPSDMPVHRSVIDKVVSIANSNQVDCISFASKDAMLSHGTDLKKYLPDGCSVIVVGTYFKLPGREDIGEGRYRELFRKYKKTARDNLNFSVLDIARELEKLGYSAVVKTALDNDELASVCNMPAPANDKDMLYIYDHVVTSCKFPENRIILDAMPDSSTAGVGVTYDGNIDIDNENIDNESIDNGDFNNGSIDNRSINNWSTDNSSIDNKSIGNRSADNRSIDNITVHIKKVCLDAGADLVGIAPASRIDSIVEQVSRVKQGEKRLLARDRNTRTLPYEPVIEETYRKLQSPGDYISDAKSVIVIGLHYPNAVAERAKKPPAEAVGPYVFAHYETGNLLGHIGFAVVKELNRMGYNAVYTHDLMNLGDAIGSPRGYLESPVCNSLEAVAAGLGQLTYNGSVYTDKYGINQRFVVVITDAELEPDRVNSTLPATSFCGECMKCVKECPLNALKIENIIEIELEGAIIQYLPLDSMRCEWESKYALCGECGFKYVGSATNEYPEGEVNAGSLANALRKINPILKHRPVTAEICITGCPLANGKRLDEEGLQWAKHWCNP